MNGRISSGLRPSRPFFAIAILISATFLSVSSCAYFTEPQASRALVVGINAYQNVSSLSYCVADSEEMGDMLSDAGYGTKRLAASSASTYVTKSNVSAALLAARNEAPADGWESFVFYYAGHGYGSSGSLAMSDATTTESSETSFSTTGLLTAVAAVPARVRVVILDSCYSGAFVTESPTVSPYPDDYTETTLFSYPFSFTLIEKAAAAFSSASSGDLIVLSAAGADETSQEIAGIGHGVFTAGLLVSSKYGDSNRDGEVTLTEAYNYAANYVQTVWNSLSSRSHLYLPRISGNALDVVLFQ